MLRSAASEFRHFTSESTSFAPRFFWILDSPRTLLYCRLHIRSQARATKSPLPTRFTSMARTTILSAQPTSDEEDNQLRPQRIKDMIGQRDVIERLNIVVDASRKRGESLGHILFDGPPGLGKTT